MRRSDELYQRKRSRDPRLILRECRDDLDRENVENKATMEPSEPQINRQHKDLSQDGHERAENNPNAQGLSARLDHAIEPTE